VQESNGAVVVEFTPVAAGEYIARATIDGKNLVQNSPLRFHVLAEGDGTSSSIVHRMSFILLK
jgi:hypothetical protein